jgi:SecD/SecF fusion protein
MSEKNLNQRLVVIVGAIVVAAIVLFDWRDLPQTNLRPGLDIAGGFSMIFEIDDTGMEDHPNLAEEMKRLLQRRVDPKGVAGIIWRVHGRNRLEVQMPLPPPQATQLRDDYLNRLHDLFASNLHRQEVLNALAQSEPQRTAELEALAARSDASIELLRAAATRYDEHALALQRLRSAPEAADAPRDPDAPAATAPAATELRQAVRDADEALEDAIDAVLATNLDEAHFVEVLEMDAGSRLRDATLGGTPEHNQGMRDRHPHLRAQIDAVVAAHARWREQRGYLDGPADLRRLLRGAGVLDFRILVQPNPDNPTQFDHYREQLRKNGPRALRDDREHWFKIDNPAGFLGLDNPADLPALDPRAVRGMIVDTYNDEWFVLAHTGSAFEMLGGADRKWQLKGAQVARDEQGRPCVHFQFDARGGDVFRQLTGSNVDRPLCILLDNVAYSWANISEAIGSSGRITGDFGQEKALYLVNTMQAGALPARLKDTPLSERTIGSSLGHENLNRAFRSGIVGLIGTLAVISVYYLLSGAIANFCMLMNVFLTLSVMALLGARVTLDGIAGLILSFGMSVDANVLIYERMREEKARGSSLRVIIKNGYDKALSTIVDSNLTTLLACVIIYFVGSEEIRGFGLMLGWGIALNLFTAVFVSRTLFAVLVKYNLLRDIHMLKLVGVPQIDWMKGARVGVPAALVIMVVGLGLLLARGANNIFDVEFLGGVNAEIEVDPRAGLNDIVIGERLRRTSREIHDDAAKLAGAQVAAANDPLTLKVRVPDVSAARLAALLSEPLEERKVNVPGVSEQQPIVIRGGVVPSDDGEHLDLHVTAGVTADQVRTIIQSLTDRSANDAENLARANIARVVEAGERETRYWDLTTTVANRALVQHAIVSALGTDLVIQPRISYVLRGEPLPITDRNLKTMLHDASGQSAADLSNFLGGALVHLDRLHPAVSVESLRTRLRNMRLQPGYQNYPWRLFDVFGLRVEDADGDGQPDRDAEGNPLYGSVAIAIGDPKISFAEDPELWSSRLAAPEVLLTRAALDTEQTLRKVSQFKPQIAGQAQARALVAVLLSWIMIIAYLWLRFGSVRYGVAGVVALMFDICMALGFVGMNGWLSGHGSPLSGWLLQDFKIDMTVVAAVLTLIGYSINDKIVIFDRVRELRGRHGQVTRETVNNAINQTFSRTLLTGTTVLMVLLVMYFLGGSSIRGFNFVMLIGVVGGTFSSIVIAAPLLLLAGKTGAAETRARRDRVGFPVAPAAR